MNVPKQVALEVIDRLAAAARLFKVVGKDDHIEIVNKSTGESTPVYSTTPSAVAELVADAVAKVIFSQIDFDWYQHIAEKESKKKVKK